MSIVLCQRTSANANRNQGGSVADALFLFKANAAKHFDGVEACAICYSVISVTDRSLPSKQCRTCKNGRSLDAVISVTSHVRPIHRSFSSSLFVQVVCN